MKITIPHRKLSLSVGALLAIAMGFAFIGVNHTSAANKDTITVTADTSTNGVTPTSPSPFPHNYFYILCLPSGSSGVVDTFRLHFDVFDTNNNAADEQAAISFNVAGNPAVTMTTAPTGLTVSETSNPSDYVDVTVSMTNPADGHYTTNLQISVDPASGFTLSHNIVHIVVNVGGACSTSEVSCFFTDSNFLALTDCSGNEVLDNAGGTFQIVTNKKGIVTATNPGQFYYNMLVSNFSGQDEDIEVDLSRLNLIPSNTDSTGHPIAQAAHADVFNTLTGATDPNAGNDWTLTNTQGTPCGPSGPCTLKVPAGDTLFVTWHLVYQWIGYPLASLPTQPVGVGCKNANEDIQATGAAYDVTAYLIDPTNPPVPIGTCTTDALGYKKK
jgi:hypothetical protein